MAAAFFSSTLQNTPDNSDDEDDLDGPVFGPKLPALFKIFDQPEEVQINMVEKADIDEVFQLYCDSEEGKRLVLKTKMPENCDMRVQINPKHAQIQLVGFIDQQINFVYKLAGAPGAKKQETLIERNFDGVQLRMSEIRPSVYAVHTANVKEDFMMLVEAFRKIIIAEHISLKYNFDVGNDWNERIRSNGEMEFSMENLDFLLDFFVGNLPRSMDQFNSAQTVGLAFRSVDGKHENLTTSISDVIQCVENILRNDVWEESVNTFLFRNGLLTNNEDKLFQAVQKYNEPSGSSQVIIADGTGPYRRIEQIVNFAGDTALISISPSRADAGVEFVCITMEKAGDDVDDEPMDMDSDDEEEDED